jgi:hypothetical protein
MTEPRISRAVGIAQAIHDDPSDPPGFALWKPWALDLADGVKALAARITELEEALGGVAAYLASCMANRHGLPLGDDCPRCKSDQRELDRIGHAFASLKEAPDD